MATRKDFLSAAASGVLLAATPPPAKPSAAPSTREHISPAARALAERMRAFDPNLTDKQIESIASGIEDNLKTGRQVNPKGRALANANEPDFTFEAAE